MVATRRKKGDADASFEEEELPLGSFGAVSKDAARNLKISGLPATTLEGGEEFGAKVRELLVGTFGLKAEQVDAVRRVLLAGADVAFVSFTARVPRNRVFTQRDKLAAPLAVASVSADEVEAALSSALPATPQAAADAAPKDEVTESPAKDPVPAATPAAAPAAAAAPEPVVEKMEEGDKTTAEEPPTALVADAPNGDHEEAKDEEAGNEAVEEEDETKDGEDKEAKDGEPKKDKPKPFDYQYPAQPEFTSEPLMQELGMFWKLPTAEEEAAKELEGRQMIVLGAGLGDVTTNVFLYHAVLRARSTDYHFDSKPPFMHPLNASSRLVLTYARPQDAMQTLIDGLWSINKKNNSPGKIKVFVPKTPETEKQEALLRKKTGSTHKPDNYVPNRQVLIRNVDRNLGEQELRSTLELADKVESVRVVQDAKNRQCVLLTFISGKYALRTAVNQGRIRLGAPDRRTKERRWCDALLMKDMTTPDFILKAEKILDKAREGNKPARKRTADESKEEGATPAAKAAAKPKEESEKEANEEPKMMAEEGAEPTTKKAKAEEKPKPKAAPQKGKGGRAATIRKPPIGALASRMGAGLGRGGGLGGPMGGRGGRMGPMRGGGAPMGPVWSQQGPPMGRPPMAAAPRMAMGGDGMGLMHGRTEQLQSMVMEQQRQLAQMSQAIQQKAPMGGAMGGSGMGGGGGMGGGFPQQRSVFDQGPRTGAMGQGMAMGAAAGRPDVWASQPRAFQGPNQPTARSFPQQNFPNAQRRY